MPLELYMLGLLVHDMPAALAFYRRLGLAVPPDSEAKSHVQIKMAGGLTFFLDSQPARWDPAYEAPPEAAPSPAGARYTSVLEFYLQEPVVLEAKFAELVGYGYDGFRPPYLTAYGMLFAMLKDPDGHTVLLSADAPPA